MRRCSLRKRAQDRVLKLRTALEGTANATAIMSVIAMNAGFAGVLASTLTGYATPRLC